jgi:hypothetical protein
MIIEEIKDWVAYDKDPVDMFNQVISELADDVE